METCKQCTTKEFHQLCIHKVPIFSSLNNEDLLKITNLIHHKQFKKGEYIIQENMISESLVILDEGSAKAFTYTSEGREQILYIFASGDFFGEQYLLSEQRATYSIMALEKVKVCMLSKNDFQQLLQTYPNIAIKIINTLGKRMARLENSLQSMGVRNIDARISSLLLEFIANYGTKGTDGILIRLPVSREGMANYLGITRETISRKLSQLETDGVIRTISNKSILILKIAHLEEVAGEVQ